MEQVIAGGLLLRELKSSDAPLFLEMVKANESRLRASFPLILSSVTNRFTAGTYVRGKMAEMKQRSFFTFVIENPAAKRLAGYVSMKNMDWTIPKAELAYFISSEYEGRGMMSEAIRRACVHAFSDLGMNKLFMRISPANPASRRVAEKCGFEKEGLIRADFRNSDGQLTDVEYWGRIKE